MDTYLNGVLITVNSAALHHESSAALSNERMRTVEEVRRLRLAQLVKEFGSYAALNEKTERMRNDSTLSQYANESENSRGGKPKAMGSAVARGLEAACKKPIGWMDTDPDLWPFDSIDLERVRNAGQRAIDKIEGAMMVTAAQLGIDIGERTGRRLTMCRVYMLPASPRPDNPPPARRESPRGCAMWRECVTSGRVCGHRPLALATPKGSR